MTLLATLAIVAMGAGTVPRSPHEAACGPDDAQLLVLGTYHMAPSGQDQFNAGVDDVRSPRRQKELAAVQERLARYAPTRIAIEAAYVGSPWPERYRGYLKDEYVLGTNEIEQIGFRLARALGHAEVHPIDFAMWMDGRVPAEIGKPRPKPAPSPAAPAPVHQPPPHVREMQALLESGTVLDVLRFVNTERYLREDHAGYVAGLRPDPDSDALYGTTDPIANWYKRNLRMFTNVYRLAEPRERILLLVGSGHGAILRRLAIDAPDICLVDAERALE
ncbi:MAG: DUF5694 domain-containing protein [Vicinamibacteria bacterium]